MPDLSFLPDQPGASATPDLSFLPDKPGQGERATDLSFLPDAAQERSAAPVAPAVLANDSGGPALRQGDAPSFWTRMMDSMRDTSAERARADNAVSMHEALAGEGKPLPIAEAFARHDELSSELGLRGQPTNAKMLELGLGAGLMSTTLGASAPLHMLGKLGVGLAEYAALGEAVSFIDAKARGNAYQFGQPKGLGDYVLPETPTTGAALVVEMADFIAKGGVIHALNKSVAGLGDKALTTLIRQKSVEYNMPRTVFIDAEKVKEVLRTGEGDAPQGVTPEELDLINTLGNGLRDAVHNGVDIEVPVEQVVTWADRPWWRLVKGMVKASPYERVTVTRPGEPSARGRQGMIPERTGEARTPEDVREDLNGPEGWAGREEPAADADAEIAAKLHEEFNRIRARSGGAVPEEIQVQPDQDAQAISPRSGHAAHFYQKRAEEVAAELNALGAKAEAVEVGPKKWQVMLHEGVSMPAAQMREAIGGMVDSVTRGKSAPPLYHGVVGPELAARLRIEGNLEGVLGYRRVINAEDIRHAWERHGPSARQATNLLPVTKDDFLLLPDLLESPDYIGQGNPGSVQLWKRVNGYLVAVEATKAKKGKLEFRTLWKVSRGNVRIEDGRPVVVQPGDAIAPGVLNAPARLARRPEETSSERHQATTAQSIIGEENAEGKPIAGERGKPIKGKAHLAEGGGYGMPMADVEAALASLQAAAPRALPLHVHQSIADAPASVQALVAEQPGPVAAIWDGQGVHLFADHIPSPEAALDIWIEEQGVHQGLRTFFANDADAVVWLEEVAKTLGKDGLSELADIYNLDLSNPDDILIAAEEAIGRIAARIDLGQDLSEPERTAWQRFVELVKDWLRKLGARFTLAEEELERQVARIVRSIFEPGDAAGADALPARAHVRPPKEETAYLLELFKRGDTTTTIRSAAGILRRYLGPKEREAMNAWAGAASSDDWSPKAEAALADLFTYYMERGLSPDLKLLGPLSTMKRWLFDLHAAASALGVPGQEHIARLEARHADPMFSGELLAIDPDAQPLRPEDIASYDQLASEARRRVAARLDAERSRNEAQMLAGWRQRGREVADSDPVQQAMADIVARGGINHAALMGMFDAETVKELMRKRPGIVCKDAAYGPDVLATERGFYDGGEAMIQAFLDAPTKAQIVADYVEGQWRIHSGPDSDRGMDLMLEEIDAEMDILAEMTGKYKPRPALGLKKAIRENTGQIKVSETVTEREALRAAFTKAAQASRKAFAEGRRDGALAEKIKQREIAQRMRDKKAASQEVEQIRGQLARVLKDEALPREYKARLREYLSRFDMVKTSKQGQYRTDSLREWLARKEAQGETVYIPADQLDRLGRIAYRDMTMEQLREVRDTVQMIVKLGRLKNTLIAGKRQRDFEQVLGTVTDRIYATSKPGKGGGGLPQAPSQRKLSPFAKFVAEVSEYHAEILKPEFIIRNLDGFEDMGPVWSELFQPIKKAEDAELAMAEKVFKELAFAFDGLEGAWAKRSYLIGGVPQRLTKEEMVMVALNSGNEGNRAALRAGFKWSDDQIDAIVGRLDNREQQLVRDVWRVIDRRFSALSGVYYDLTGCELRKVEGDYFPLMFDRELSWRADRNAAEQEARDFFATAYAKPKTESGFTTTRVGGKMPPLLSFNVITRHLSDTIHYITHAIPVRDVQKLTSHAAFRAAVTDTRGAEVYRQITPWLQEIAKPRREPLSKIEAWAGRLRRNTTIVMLGAKVSVAAKQFLSFTQTIDAVGLPHSLRALSSFYSSPWESAAFVDARSKAMANRRTAWDRELKAMYDRFDPKELRGAKAVKDAFFAMIGLVDAAATYPTWLAAYAKGMEAEGWDEAKAIEYADMIVRTTQPTASPKDLAAVQRGSEMKKSLTMFYSFFSVFANRFGEAHAKYGAGKISLLGLMKSYWWLLVAPALLGDMINKRRPVSKEEAARAVGSYLVAGLPYVRDVAGPMITGFDYSVSPTVEGPESLITLARALTKDKPEGRKVLRAGIDTAGYVWGLPSKQAVITMDGLLDMAHGKTNDPTRLLFKEAK